jgi:beta-N-acetylhexosaminidase
VAAWEEALEDASELPLERAAGQVLIPAWSSPDAGSAAALVSQYSLGGLILMTGSIVDAGQVTALTASIEAAAAADGRDWPAMVAVDQEGGTVARLAPVVPDLPGFMAAGSASDKQLVTEAYSLLAADMRALGFTVDFAPVADITVGMSDPVIRVRSAGSGMVNVADTVGAAVDGFMAGGVIPTVKHFPGHGSVSVDSHDALPVMTAEFAFVEKWDLVPFRRAVNEGVPAVMMGHIAVPEWGSGPASLTPAAYDYLRDELGFTGLAVTDALNMGAITAAYGPGDAAVAALAAGADALVIPADVGAAHAAIVAAVTNGTLPRERLDEAVARSILVMRWQEGIVPVERDATGAYASEFAASAISVASSQCGGAFVVSPVHITGGSEGERAAFSAALATHGIATGRGGSTVRLLGAPDGSDSATVVVAMDGPWGLPASNATTYVGLFGRSADSLTGLAAVLAGAVAPQGAWPVDMSGLPVGTC